MTKSSGPEELKIFEERFQLLAEDLYSYIEKNMEKKPSLNPHILFQDWMLQKLTALQVVVETIATIIAPHAKP